MGQARTGIALLGVACLAAACAGSAASGPAGPGAGKPGIALKRGAAWATYTVDLPRIVGPTAELRFKDGALRGFMGSRTLNVTIHDADADGFGPGGPVTLTMENGDGQTKVEGMWNGGPVHFVFAANSITGSVIVRKGRVGEESSCNYQLDHVDTNGALTGFSICTGLPQNTRLEIDAPVARMLKPSELTVLLIAIFASPPQS